MAMGEDIRWFSLGTAEKLLAETDDEHLQAVRDLLLGKIYGLFDDRIRVSHLQLHHYCQPRQNETLLGKSQFDQKNKLTLEPVISELETLYKETHQDKIPPCIYLHIADANLDELRYRSTDLLVRLQQLVRNGYVKIVGGVLDEAFVGPDPEAISEAAIIRYIEKVIDIFGEEAVAPFVWIPERFFEDSTSNILNNVYSKYSFLRRFQHINLIVDENVVAHSLPADWDGNLYTAWKEPDHDHLKIYVSSNHLRAVMPQATPEEVNEYFFSLMGQRWSHEEIAAVNWFIEQYEAFINQYYYFCHHTDNNTRNIQDLTVEINRFYIDAREGLESLRRFHVFFVDDLEKNGSWLGTHPFAFEEKRHFYRYLKQASNIFNPYRMRDLSKYHSDVQEIKKMRSSSYKEFSIVWNNNPLEVEKWRQMTLSMVKQGVSDVDQLRSMDDEALKAMNLSSYEISWYLDFVRSPVSWKEGQLSKYPEIKLNNYIARAVLKQIVSELYWETGKIRELLANEHALASHLLHIWNKNRASCPNFIGFFGGASILFFRLHIAFQLASVLSLIHAQSLSVLSDIDIKDSGETHRYTLVKAGEDYKIIDERGDTLFYFSSKNLHSLTSGFSRHREGYNSIIKEFVQGRTDSENFALVDKAGGTTSSHPLVLALDLERMEDTDIIRDTYPEDLDHFDTEQELLNPFPTAWDQVWILPPNTSDNPMLNYQEGYFGDFKWLKSDTYVDWEFGKRIQTHVNKVLYNHKQIEIVKKIYTESLRSKVEIWNRSDKPVTFNPVIAFPTSLDWYEGENYTANGQTLPLGGDITVITDATLQITDKISNLKLTFDTTLPGSKYFLTTVYTYQTSDYGAYTVSPQHLLVLLSGPNIVCLHPGQGYIIEYSTHIETLTSESPWNIDWDAMPQALKMNIQRFREDHLEKLNLTDFQMMKLIYSRYPEIIFWASQKI